MRKIMRDRILAKPPLLSWLTFALLFVVVPSRGAASQLPTNLLISPHASPHHVILVEKSSQRLFIYQFDGTYELIATYNCATGEYFGDKRVSGDRKTPEGIYFFTKAVGEQYLTSTYGPGPSP